ncbi:Urease subunit alpha [Dissostichus eleginoides]|uniref:Urease subunit alpha n=1 Tax=Dissostichus eleginoides TaxID=100907 RepID=A0AAD9CEK5_DISEL|nr:Urease subunit alpha [Dissostichus eleginoides]
MMAEKLSDIVTFLRGRGVPEDTANFIEEQKIDRDVILLMEDAQLANYLPSYGDRIALFNFCKHHTNTSKRKEGLFDKLRQKLKLRKEGHSEEEVPETSRKSRRKAKQSTRNIEIGWVHTIDKVTKQVRAKQGGGTRKVPINVHGGFNDILKEGKALFFPEGKSSKGHKSDFKFDVWDFKQNPFPNDVSIEMIYDTVKLPLLRFYIATQPKSVLHEEAHDDSDCDSFVSEPDLLPQNKQSTLEFTIETNNQLMTDESHDFLPEVFIISEESVTEESFTESSVNRENPASPFANINSDPITLSAETNYTVFEADTSDPEITFGPAQTGADDNLSDTLIYQHDELPQSPL